MSWEYGFVNFDKFHGYMKDVEKRLIDYKRAHEYIAAKAWKDVIAHFQNQEGPEGQKWDALKNPRKREGDKSKSASRGGNKILQDTGKLRQSIKFRGESDGAYVYTALKYAPAHQFGADIPDRVLRDKSKKAMPMMTKGGLIFRKSAKGFKLKARPFMWLSRKFIYEFQTSLAEYIYKGKPIS